jgi:hypothetical protein
MAMWLQASGRSCCTASLPFPPEPTLLLWSCLAGSVTQSLLFIHLLLPQKRGGAPSHGALTGLRGLCHLILEAVRNVLFMAWTTESSGKPQFRKLGSHDQSLSAADGWNRSRLKFLHYLLM